MLMNAETLAEHPLYLSQFLGLITGFGAETVRCNLSLWEIRTKKVTREVAEEGGAASGLQIKNDEGLTDDRLLLLAPSAECSSRVSSDSRGAS